MLIIFILLVLTMIIVSNIQSVNNLKTSSYLNSISSLTAETGIYEDKMIKESLDSFCRNNFNTCNQGVIDGSGEYLLSTSDLIDYMPPFQLVYTPQYDGIILDRNNSKIRIEVNIASLDKRKNYLNNYLNEKQDLSCRDGSALPCEGNDRVINKKINYSEELKIKFIDYDYSVLQDLIDEEEAKDDPDQDLIDGWTADQDVLTDNKNDLLVIIKNRKITGF